MADYYPLLSRAVSGLAESTPETRRMIYERARTALLQQLRSLEPPLSEADIARERLSLDDVIRRVEAEQAAAALAAANEAASTDSPAIPAPLPAEPPPAPAPEAPAAAPAAEFPEPGRPEHHDWRDERASGWQDRDVPGRPAQPETDERPSLNDTVADADGPVRERPRLEPLRPADDRSGRRRTIVVASVLGVVVASIASAAWLLRDQPVDLQKQAELAAAQEPVADGDRKFTDRIGGGAPAGPAGQQAARTDPPAQPGGGPRVEVPVSQRAILYEESPDNPQAPRSMSGRVVWRLDAVNPGQGQALETIVRADLEIPEAGLSLAFVFRRNVDPTLPASHTIEMAFANTGGEDHSVRDVGVPQLKGDEAARGAPLSGLPVPVTQNFFLVGLSNLKADMERNADLMKTRGWIDIPVRFANGRRGVLAFEKGLSGDQAVAEAFHLWN